VTDTAVLLSMVAQGLGVTADATACCPFAATTTRRDTPSGGTIALGVWSGHRVESAGDR
jgi:hypothetical protein